MLLERNREVAATHEPIPLVTELQAQGKMGELTTMVVTCVDPRCIPENYFNLKTGEVFVNRNVGGNIQYAMRDILILNAAFPDSFQEIIVVHHTDCGSLRFKDDGMDKLVKNVIGEAHSAAIDNVAWAGVVNDLEWFRSSPIVPKHMKDKVRGLIFDIQTGKVEEVK
ncbi:hypothetical protein M441DRAFT_28298 [Trichoderma asperellum CBS 433.97]|uniref:Carbonic anhydrase n=1 Tax=Trichoderma asperellum (strain ATCC 204424 / CBS 433.97 / NBRC 101777) TaxID=1042311 RepID=A0A2T3Z2V2_TRIA4|nr:hypothetical protein M441DRAFT_28298 [Trichoderma asperellum CBS 433.97]PTB39134.1 hypothetical protein M441DRAFT_28298 [Trichoderma asperellum CBS 433.97]